MTSGFKGRGFQIYVELLAAPNQVQTRSYGYDYTIVVTPSPEPRAFEIRHAYLHYLLDPLATRNQEVLDRKKPLADYALRAPALEDSFKQSFLDLTTESLIKAIEARLDHKTNGVEQALRQGFILAPYFAEQLPIYEKQEQAMALYYPEMAKAIDLRKEDARLSSVVFDKQAPEGAVVKTPAPPAPPPLSGAAKTLDEAERLYRTQDKANLETAKKLYLESLEQTQDGGLQASAYYGLARIAALQRDPETADRLFRKTLELAPEPPVKAWTLVYLGRFAQAAGEREEAARHFQEALKVDGAPDAARKAAVDGLQNNAKQ
jgi:tetratricopeptide (TPR) repeat protein